MLERPATAHRVLLVRHGRSAHEHDGSWIDADRARQFEDRYDAAPIRTDDAPPGSLLETARLAQVILASDLPRAITSAHTLAPHREPITSPLLRELRFDLPSWAPRLPLNTWDALHYLMWTARLFVGAESAETQRARRAAEWVDSFAASAALTVAVTHGGFRRLLAVQLARRGWIAERGLRRYHNWSVWAFTRAEPT
jgi:broad specificity phosphatase PhoE